MNKPQLPIYLDYMATTPQAPEALEAMLPYLRQPELSGNASSLHAYGQIAKQAVLKASTQAAFAIQANPEDIVWTSGATESNNLALKGAAFFYQSQGKHIISSETEHKSVLSALEYLQHHGFDVTLLKPQPSGLISVDQIQQAIRSDTILISIMHVNNEIGVIQPIAEIGALTRQKGILLHVDAAQSPGKTPIYCQDWQVDLLSLSGHKLYGPKGVGILYVPNRPKVRLQSQIQGGGQQKGIRSGTLPIALIVGMGEALALACERLDKDTVHAQRLFDKLCQQTMILGDIILNGNQHSRVPHNFNISVPGVEGESLQFALRDFALSTASACTTATIEPSHVLRSIGLSDELAHSSLRLSTGRLTTKAEIDKFSTVFNEQVTRLRQLSGYTRGELC